MHTGKQGSRSYFLEAIAIITKINVGILIMSKRKLKSHRGIYKQELQNESLKIKLNQLEHNMLVVQVNGSKYTQSEYLRYLLLDAPHRTAEETPKLASSLTSTINRLGQRLNQKAKTINKAMLSNERIEIATDETIFVDLAEVLKLTAPKIVQIREQKCLVRDIQVRFLVTPTQLEQAEAKLKLKKLRLSSYLRQQITGYRQTKYKNKADEVASAISRVVNNINQILGAIRVEESAHRLVIVSQETKLQIEMLKRQTNQLKQELMES